MPTWTGTDSPSRTRSFPFHPADSTRLANELGDALLREASIRNDGIRAQDYRKMLANPVLQTKEFALKLIREQNIHETLTGDPDLYYLKSEIHSVLKRQHDKDRRNAHATIANRGRSENLTAKEIRAYKALADETLRREYEPHLALIKDPAVSAFTLVTLSTFVPYLFLDPVAKWAGAHLSQWASLLPGIYAPGTALANGATAFIPQTTTSQWFQSSAFSDPWLLGAFFIGNAVTALCITGLRDTFKFSKPLMTGLDILDRHGDGNWLSQTSQSLKKFISRPEPKQATTSELLIHHGIVGYENSLLEDTTPAPSWILSARNYLSKSSFKFLKSIGEALPATKGEWNMYKTDVAALNAPVVALFSGLLPVAADLTHQYFDPSYTATFSPSDILTRGAMAIGAGLLAWSVGCIGNTRIMNHHKKYSPAESANNLATRDRQIYSIVAYIPIMAFLIPNYHWAWQQGIQIASATALLGGLSLFYSQKEARMRETAK